jgi:hypothetical protein
MTISDLLLQDFDFEISNTRRTLERLPEDRNGWKCHDKSMELGKLTMHCATLPLFGFYILADDGMDMAASKRAQVPLVFTTRGGNPTAGGSGKILSRCTCSSLR